MKWNNNARLILILVISLLFTTLGYSSTLVAHWGTYETQSFSFAIETREASGIFRDGRGYSSKRILFNLSAKDGYLILEGSSIIYDGTKYIFEAETIIQQQYYNSAKELTISSEESLPRNFDLIIDITILNEETQQNESIHQVLEINRPNVIQGPLTIIEKEE